MSTPIPLYLTLLPRSGIAKKWIDPIGNQSLKGIANLYSSMLGLGLVMLVQNL